MATRKRRNDEAIPWPVTGNAITNTTIMSCADYNSFIYSNILCHWQRDCFVSSPIGAVPRNDNIIQHIILLPFL